MTKTKTQTQTTGKHVECSFPGCEGWVIARNLCYGHYQQIRRGLELKPLQPHSGPRAERTVCPIEGCEIMSTSGRLCNLHRTRKAKYGDPNYPVRPTRKRDMTLEEVARWCLTNADRNERGCLIWRGAPSAAGYAATSVDGEFKLVRYLIEEFMLPPRPKGKVLHHACGDKLCIAPEHFIWTSHKIVCRSRSLRSRRSPSCRLTAEQVWDIRDRLRDGKSLAAIAREFDINYKTVHSIKSGASWGWLPYARGNVDTLLTPGQRRAYDRGKR